MAIPALPSPIRRNWPKPRPKGSAGCGSRCCRPGPIEVDLFGDFHARGRALPRSNAAFGALPMRTSVAPPPLTPHLPAHNDTPLVLTHRGDPDAAAAHCRLAHRRGGRTGLRESRQLELLAQIYSNRLVRRDARKDRGELFAASQFVVAAGAGVGRVFCRDHAIAPERSAGVFCRDRQDRRRPGCCAAQRR